MIFLSSKRHYYTLGMAALFLLAPVFACAEGGAFADRRYPSDNDEDYSIAPVKSFKKGAAAEHYPSDNDESYVPFVLRENAAPAPAKPAPSHTERQQQGNQSAYPSDNDGDYKAPNPSGSDGDKYYYPLYY